MSMFKRDSKTGEEIAFRVTTPRGNTVIAAGYSEDFWRQTPGAEVEEVRGHSRPDGFVVERTVD